MVYPNNFGVAGIAATRGSAGSALLAIGIVAIGLAGCALAPNAALPSQSGTLEHAAAVTPVKEARFNPFSSDDAPALRRREVIEKPTIEQVMVTGQLPERSIGRPDAPITVIKYASLSCPYCRKFHIETFPLLKKRYIDTGRVRFIIREFPIGFQSGSATIALRCVAPEKYFATYDAFIRSQERWISTAVRREPIWQVVRKLGLTRAKFDACYKDAALVENLKWVKNRGRTLGVIGTPNFFINNKLHKRVLTMTDFDAAISQAGMSVATR